MQTLNIVIAGVGGQGTLLASRVLGSLAQKLKLDVKVSEVHGMSQRGGSVVTFVRMGDKIYSPLVEQGMADYLLAFEKLEAVRYLPLVKKGGTIIVNTQEILPMPVMIGAAKYPSDIVQTLEAVGPTVQVQAQEIATKAGNLRTINTVLLGVLAAKLNFDVELWHSALEDSIPKKFMQVNMAAFDLGFNNKQ